MAIKASNQITLIDLTDGYSVIMTNESHTFLGTTNSVSGTQTTTCMIQALCGSEQVACTIGNITAPTGLSIVSDGKTPVPTLTITATSALTSSGSVLIPVTIGDVVITKTFSYSIAFRGQTGSNGTSVTIQSTAVTYQVGDSGTTAPTGAWSSTIPSTPTGKYLWTKTVVTYSDGKSTTSYSVSRSGTNGTNGSNGQDALSMVILSSNGNIFKNTNIATTLSGHIYKGGVEVTGSALTALGTIKWYKDEGTTSVATGSNLTINPGDVNNYVNYTAKLES